MSEQVGNEGWQM